MTTNQITLGQRFMNSVVCRNKVDHFKSSVPASFNILMNVKNKEERLTSLLKLLADVESDINEIATLCNYHQSGDKTFLSDMNWEEYLNLSPSPTIDQSRNEKAKAIVDELKDYKVPIVQEIAKLQLHRSTLRKYTTKSHEEQFIDLFRDSSKVNKVISLLKGSNYIDGNEKWIGRTDNKGELKVVYEVLRENDIFKKGKITTQARLFYLRFKYDGKYDERTLRNNINNPDILCGFNTLFAPLFKK